MAAAAITNLKVKHYNTIIQTGRYIHCVMSARGCGHHRHNYSQSDQARLVASRIDRRRDGRCEWRVYPQRKC